MAVLPSPLNEWENVELRPERHINGDRKRLVPNFRMRAQHVREHSLAYGMRPFAMLRWRKGRTPRLHPSPQFYFLLLDHMF